MKITIVTPWFDPESLGGCEQVALQLAKRLSKKHVVTVLTTCSPSMVDHWGKHYPPASYKLDGVTVKRLICDQADRESFAYGAEQINQATELKPGIEPASPKAVEAYWENGINSEEVLKALRSGDADRIILLPYLYGVIAACLTDYSTKHLWPKMFLMPCLHREGYAFLHKVEAAFHNAGGLLFLSHGEQQLAQQLYGPGILPKSAVVGAGIEPTKPHPIDKIGLPYVLAIGIRPGKGVELLIEAFRSFKAAYPENRLVLVLVGESDLKYHHADISQMGSVTEAEKHGLLKNCLALFNPSQNESYSRAMFEAWHHGRPVVVHADCLATAGAVEACNGGWTAGTVEQWRGAFNTISIASVEQMQSKGGRGKAYSERWANWDRAIRRIEKAIALPAPPLPLDKQPIHQLLAGTIEGDAITNHALHLRAEFRAQGHPSEIYAEHCNHPDTFHLGELPPHENYELVYHHSLSTLATAISMEHSGAKRLIYHNVTPAKFIQKTRPHWVGVLKEGREILPWLVASGFDSIQAVSEYNAQELRELGAEVEVMPLPAPVERWDIEPDYGLMSRLQDGKVNLLFVGRLAENKCQHHLIEAYQHFRRLSGDQDSRLLLVGGGDTSSYYYRELQRMAAEVEGVELLGKLSEAGLAACYRCAHLYWSMSEHEGFGVPFVEARQHALPVLAYDSSAVGETVGEHGLLFADKKRLDLVGAIARVLVTEYSSAYQENQRKIVAMGSCR